MKPLSYHWAIVLESHLHTNFLPTLFVQLSWWWEMQYSRSVSKQVCCRHSDSGPPCAFLSPRGTQEGRIPAIWQPLGCSHSLRQALRNSGCEKHKIQAPYSWEAYERSDFSDPWLLHLPIHRKALNSLTWDIWFPSIHKNTFDAQATCRLLHISKEPDSSRCLLRAVHSGLLECCLLGLSSKNFHQIKYNAQLFGQHYF